MIRVMIVSNAQAVRIGLKAMLSPWASDSFTVGQPDVLDLHEAASIVEAGEADSFADVDVLIISSDFSKADLMRLAEELPGQLAVLLLIERLQPLQSLVELPWRAWGVLPLDSTSEELIAAVRALFEGLLVGSPGLLGPRAAQHIIASGSPESAWEKDALIEPLTDRETEVLQLLAQGLANKQIATRLAISEHTVKFHVSAIFTRLGVGSRTEAVRAGIQRGLISF